MTDTYNNTDLINEFQLRQYMSNFLRSSSLSRH